MYTCTCSTRTVCACVMPSTCGVSQMCVLCTVLLVPNALPGTCITTTGLVSPKMLPQMTHTFRCKREDRFPLEIYPSNEDISFNSIRTSHTIYRKVHKLSSKQGHQEANDTVFCFSFPEPYTISALEIMFCYCAMHTCKMVYNICTSTMTNHSGKNW